MDVDLRVFGSNEMDYNKPKDLLHFDILLLQISWSREHLDPSLVWIDMGFLMFASSKYIFHIAALLAIYQEGRAIETMLKPPHEVIAQQHFVECYHRFGRVSKMVFGIYYNYTCHI